VKLRVVSVGSSVVVVVFDSDDDIEELADVPYLVTITAII
jgi:hypothetical protein